MLAALAFAAAVAAAAPAVCADPAKPCPGFRAHDLSFPLPQDGVARAEVRSAPFFAVILVSGAPCRVSERAAADAMLARVKATGRFPGANVRRMQAVFVYP